MTLKLYQCIRNQTIVPTKRNKIHKKIKIKKEGLFKRQKFRLRFTLSFFLFRALFVSLSLFYFSPLKETGGEKKNIVEKAWSFINIQTEVY